MSTHHHSLRHTRDTYVNLLLSTPPPMTTSQPSVPHSAPNPPRHSWTPGQHLQHPHSAPPSTHPMPPPTPSPHVHWASPVTPLSDNHLRVAEVAAELVAAGDSDRRNKQALRELADKLERSERHNRHLERALGSTKKNLDFTPVTPRRRSSSGDSVKYRERRRRSSSFAVDAERNPDSELARLRMESDLWVRERARFREERELWLQERDKLSGMFNDIKRSTDRLLQERGSQKRHLQELEDERERHLKLIHHLQQSHFRQEQSEESFPGAPPQVSPLQPLGRSSLHPVQLFHDDARNDMDRNHRGSDGGRVSSRDQETINELQRELQTALDENAKFGDRNAHLESRLMQLEERVQQRNHLQNDYEELVQSFNQLLSRHADGKGTEAEKAYAGMGNHSSACNDGAQQVGDIKAQLKDLEAEVDFLEAVAAAMQFNISSSEADRLQETLTQIQDTDGRCTSSSISQENTVENGEGNRRSMAERLESVTKRLVQIRKDQSVKYGKWLEAVANDTTTNTTSMSIDSRVIDKLVCD